jgi:hypothetical protein
MFPTAQTAHIVGVNARREAGSAVWGYIQTLLELATCGLTLSQAEGVCDTDLVVIRSLLAFLCGSSLISIYHVWVLSLCNLWIAYTVSQSFQQPFGVEGPSATSNSLLFPRRDRGPCGCSHCCSCEAGYVARTLYSASRVGIFYQHPPRGGLVVNCTRDNLLSLSKHELFACWMSCLLIIQCKFCVLRWLCCCRRVHYAATFPMHAWVRNRNWHISI